MTRNRKRSRCGPRGARTAWILYYQHYHAVVARELQQRAGGTVGSTEVTREVARRWRGVGEEEKGYFLRLQEGDKERFLKETEEYNAKKQEDREVVVGGGVEATVEGLKKGEVSQENQKVEAQRLLAAKTYFQFVASNWREVGVSRGLWGAQELQEELSRMWMKGQVGKETPRDDQDVGRNVELKVLYLAEEEKTAFLKFRSMILEEVMEQEPGVVVARLEGMMREKWQALDVEMKKEFFK